MYKSNLEIRQERNMSDIVINAANKEHILFWIQSTCGSYRVSGQGLMYELENSKILRGIRIFFENKEDADLIREVFPEDIIL